ncbi:hypothetical protein FACS1894133_2570 [Clostridia bacterium]|nr:hypothetical protein FACS1894133_2570 [Clostridia bacterium]
MDKQAAVISYKTSMTVFKKWLADGILTSSDLSEIDTKLCEKYGISSCSIYRDNTCYTVQKER